MWWNRGIGAKRGSVTDMKNINHVCFLNRPQQIQTDSSRHWETLGQSGKTDSKNSLIWILSQVVEQGYNDK